MSLSRELAYKDEVTIFHRIADPEREEYEMKFGNYNGLHICTINNTFKYCNSFEKIYKNPLIAKQFGHFLDKVNPDIAHFGHVTCLSTSMIEEAKNRNIPVVFTLHDFWLFCQLGQLLKRDLSLCHGPKDYECARCLAPHLSINKRVAKFFEITKRSIPNFLNRSILEKVLRQFHRQCEKAFFFFQKDSRSQIRERTTHIKEMCSQVDLFIAPSKFLLRKFVEFGIPEDKIVYHDYGFNTALFKGFERASSPITRFGYIGTFIPSKGVHVLLEAFNRLNYDNAELRIHGKFVPYHSGFEGYPGYLRSLDKKQNVLWFGEYNNKDIAGILSEIDILVVPSIWHENSPLTIHEAFMAGVPVITSNIGGMAELIQDRVTGLLFRAGDSKDLLKKMGMIIDDPGFIERLRSNIKPVIPIESHALKIREIYRSLINGNN